MSSHDELRQLNRQRRAALDAARLDAAGAALAARITALDWYRDARTLAAYIAINGEIGLGPVIDDALARGKRVFVPIIDGRTLHFAPWFPGQRMARSRFGLFEPDVPASERIAPADVDLVLVPLTVFDAECNRIGMGGGYYDRSYAFRREPGSSRPRLLGVAHELQRVDRIEPNAWDVRLDGVATDAALYGASA